MTAGPVASAVVQSYHLTVRDLRNSLRQPSYVLAALIQPIAWLLLFGKLLGPLLEHGSADGSYLAFLTPGIVAMTAVFSSGWAGMGIVAEMEHGTLNRFLITPVPRGALVTGRLTQQAVVVLGQTLIVLAFGLALGARFSGGVLILVVFFACVLLGALSVAALSNALGLVTRRHQRVLSVGQFLLLPLAFLSEIFVPRDVMPGWMRAMVTVNPVNWVVEVGREATRGDVGWAGVLDRTAGLLALTAACAWLSAMAFRHYQRQV